MSRGGENKNYVHFLLTNKLTTHQLRNKEEEKNLD